MRVLSFSASCIAVRKCYECSYGNPYGREYDPYAYSSDAYDNTRVRDPGDTYDKYDSRRRQDISLSDRPVSGGTGNTRDKYDGTQWTGWRSTYYEHNDQNKWFSALTNSGEGVSFVLL